VTADNNTITGEIISVDNFGNAISNIRREDLAKMAAVESKENFRVMFKNEPLPLVHYYAENESSGLSAIINSFGHVELFVFRDRASDKYNIKIGDNVIVSLA